MIGFRLWQIAGWTMLHYFWVGAVFIVVGLVLTFSVAVETSLESFWLSDRVMRFAAYNSYGHYVAAFAAVIGIACLVAPRWLRR